MDKIPKIRFSHMYYKMPQRFVLENGKHIILNAFVVEDIKKMDEKFLDYDTAFFNKREDKIEHYTLDFRKGIIIVIFSYTKAKIQSDKQIWTTIRRFHEKKWKYYKSLIGKEVEIEIMV